MVSGRRPLSPENCGQSNPPLLKSADFDQSAYNVSVESLKRSDVNKNLTFKANAKAKDLTFKAKAKAEDLTFKAKAKAEDLTFKAKAKADDLIFKAKAKDLIFKGNQGQGQGLNFQG